MTIGEAITRHEASLREAGIESARVDMEWMLVHMLDLSRSQLQLETDRILTSSEQRQLQKLGEQRAQRIPLQHLLGEVDFHGLCLQVDGRVLVPRPETELLAEAAIKILDKYGGTRVLDIGTGSGCLAISIAVTCSEVQIDALDISADALAVARENAIRHQVADRILCLNEDLRKRLPAGPYNMIVSNPPYIQKDKIGSLPPSVQYYDPENALTDGGDGLTFYRRIFDLSDDILNDGGRIILEFDSKKQSQDIINIFSGFQYTIYNDFSNNPRAIELIR